MKVLFVSRKKKDGDISPIVRNQANGLKKVGISPDIFMVNRGGIKGYYKFVGALRKHIKKNPDYSVIHAHYSFTAFCVSLVKTKNLVVSLMGSDVKAKGFYRVFIKLFNALFWKACIVKSEDMKSSSGIRKAIVIPNGVNFERFKPMNKDEAQKKLSFNPNKKHILFAADPSRYEKNYMLAEQAFEILNDPLIQIHHLIDVPNEMVPYHYNASDVVLLTSLWEGSPNVIKEANACNIPVVTTNVGDVESYLPKVKYSAITTYQPKDVANKLRKAIDSNQRTNGREVISFLNDAAIAAKIIDVYKSVATKK